MMNQQHVLRWLERIADVLKVNREYLTQLDTPIGDADHGRNMDRGFSALVVKIPAMESMDMATILETVGLTLVSTVGGASGPLYGTGFLRAGFTVAGKENLDAADIVAMLELSTPVLSHVARRS